MSHKKSKQAQAHEFSASERRKIIDRDYGECIFCRKGYKMSGGTEFAKQIKSIMHYIPRGQGGLGTAENGAVGCQYHHDMMDNGNQGNREEMLEIFKAHLQQHYPDWSEDKLVYSKWRFLKAN